MRAKEFIVENARNIEHFDGIDVSIDIEDDEVLVQASAGGRKLGHVLFVEEDGYLMPQDLEVDERFRGQGIARTMYDFVKSKGYQIRRSGQQTDAGAGFWAKHRPEQNVWESVDADQVLDYVKRTHAPDEFDIEYSITNHPQWELKNIPLSQLNLDPDGEERDPYNRVNWVDYDKVEDLIPRIKTVLAKNPIVVDSQGWIIDGNHRATAAAEVGLTHIPAYVPVAQNVTEDLYGVKQGVAENFADGKVRGKSRPGRVKRAGASCDGSVTDLRARARKYGGERGKMYHWCANMKGGKKK